MKRVKITPGRAVRLDDRRTTSVRGGEYDISALPDSRQRRIARLPGVKEQTTETAEAATAPRGRARRRPRRPEADG
jgi:hypothetical protein